MNPVLVQAEQLGFSIAGRPLLAALDFAIRPGLNLVRGGDGRGKTTLLRLLAGELQPGSGRLHRQVQGLSFERPAEEVHDPVQASAWLAARREVFAASWQAALADALVVDFGLAEHLDKPMYMLSTGSRRKVGLVAAAASGAGLTLLDTPFAALDARSGRRLSALLNEATVDPQRAWVLADYALPAGLADLPLAALVDLGE
ncbi:MAG TPA: ATP-binding cassette domain-containing protein [Ideonella sp.]|uniref:ABC transporter ATP-binding protein n=1 Tax=Ideonella sp. TaxID=1929293 RepID=UPI002BDF1C6A|nr:ATP-binding cassette domain-containing protein [Ideonella sp.]HSI51289.1 ATP-binding cassette domain-containing protein [Ideonella sp.]